MGASDLLYRTAQVRAMDQYAIDQGVPGYVLMGRAGEAALCALRRRWPQARELLIIAGGGNNGGDGYVLARLARAAGFNARLAAAVTPAALRGDAARACEDYRREGGVIEPFVDTLMTQADVIVDALLGTGLSQMVRPELRAVIEAINRSARPVLALDVPSGLDADTGAVLGAAVRAEATVTFVAMKRGLLLGAAPTFTGEVELADLGLRVPPGAAFAAALERLQPSICERALPPRPHDAHKGTFGRVLIVGGGRGMPGAVRLAGEAALRVGAGLVTVATAPENLVAVNAGRPELIVHEASALATLLPEATTVAVGPGLGRSAWADQVLDQALGCGKPLVIDADALNALAARRARAPDTAVLTPHPGEAARLLGCTTADVQADRPAALAALCAAHPGAVIVLKGAGTLIGQAGPAGSPPRTPAICSRGNPLMASAGMGDVLTGAIAGILAQCADRWLAACAGVMAHAMSGDALARARPRSILALDLACRLSTVEREE